MAMAKPLTGIGLMVALASCAGLGGGDPDLYERLGDRDVALAAEQLQNTLERSPDGATRGWRNDQTGNGGSITPTRTYLSEAGRHCREYREELIVGDQRGRFFHVACRGDDAQWTWI
jgi:surface antigen